MRSALNSVRSGMQRAGAEPDEDDDEPRTPADS
jgi:hypothetical protein